MINRFSDMDGMAAPMRYCWCKSWCIALCVVLACWSSASGADVLAATATVSLVPERVEGVPMTGYARGYEALSEGLHDSLYARLLLLQEGGLRLVIASVDLIGFNVDRDPQTGRLAQLLSDLGVDGWFIVSTHTHGGPRVLDLGAPYKADRNWPMDERYVDWVENRIARGVESIVGNLVPVKFYVGNGHIELGFNRRLVHEDGRVEMIWGRGREVPPEKLGPIDPQVGVVRVDREDGTPLAVLFTHACHAVVLGAANRLLTADFPGYASAFVEREMPGATALFIQGAGGDVDPYIDVQNRFEPAVAQGEQLGAEVVRVATAPMQRIYSTPLLGWETIDSAYDRFGRSGSAVPTRLSMLSLGGQWAMLGLPGEPFVELGLNFKQWAPVPYAYLVGYTNGYAGYFPTLQAHREGGYGANYGDTMHLAADSGEDMVRRGLDVLNGRVWQVRPPEAVRSGEPARMRGELNLSAFAPLPTDVFLDATLIGGAERHALQHTGNGIWTLDWSGAIDWPLGQVELPFYRVDSSGVVQPLLRNALRVEPGGAVALWDGQRATRWTMQAAERVQWRYEPSYEGLSDVLSSSVAADLSSSLGAFWTLDWLPERPLALQGFAGLSFAFHPGSFSGDRPPLIVLSVNDKTVSFAEHIDWQNRQWQQVFIAAQDLADVGMVERVRFWGRGHGTFHLRAVQWMPSSLPTLVAGQGDAAESPSNRVAAWPNPFNGQVSIQYRTERAGPISVLVYNAMGQRVRSLVDEWADPGLHHTKWDGMADSGRPMASGIYFVKITHGAAALAGHIQKVVLLR